jgi:hypothetical protein
LQVREVNSGAARREAREKMVSFRETCVTPCSPSC